VSGVLSEHLPLLAAAPDGIQKLRGLILELAVRGKLVPQDPNDEPARELLKRIAKERVRLEAEGTCRRSKPTPLVSNDEQPFALPEGWAWIRLGQIGDWGAGATPLRSNPRYYGGSIPWFKSGELTADFISDAEEHVTELAQKECSLRQNRTGDVLIAMYGATIGKTAILAKPATTNQAVCACTPNTGIFNRYLLTLLKALKPNFIGQGAGGAQPNISREKIVATVAALPPEAEQHRIVAKVDELMALCDRLEAEQADAASAHARLVKTLLGTLTQSTDAADLAANWQRLAEHFDTLFTTEASIDALKQTVLQLAVMGKLVPQDANDEPASELLKQVAKERARLEADGVCKKSKATPLEGGGDQAFAIPDTWLWASLGNISVTSTGKTPATSKAEYYGDILPFIGPGQLTPAGEILPPEKLLSDAGRTETTLAKAGDILMVCIGGSIGKAAIANMEIAFNQQINCASPILISSKYLYSGMTAQYFQKAVLAKATGSATPIINRSNWDEIPLPIAPLAEQHRIVAKVDQLMALCDHLKADLAAALLEQTTLADTLIKSALEAA
jgi:type I restriction enzyme S subunit